MSKTDAAIHFHPEGYDLTGKKLMGRHAAGAGFLRAALKCQQDRTLFGYCPDAKAARYFGETAQNFQPGVSTKTLTYGDLRGLAEVGALYTPGPSVGKYASQRMRRGVRSYSVVGITHTTASHNAMDSITSLIEAPVMPWDALIMSSTAVRDSVRVVLDAEVDYLRWRYGPGIQITLPQLPVIPLGVHLEDHEITPDARAAARKALGIAEDEVVALFMGRLSFHAKAHPHAMYIAMERAAQATGKKLALMQCGWFANDGIEGAFKDGAKKFCPSVRALFTDGRDPELKQRAFAATDIFFSLSDNYQETFGLTPIEAMASGLPALVSDWNGYKDTVRDGIDGYRITTYAPAPGTSRGYAAAYEEEAINYDRYIGVTCYSVAVDFGQLERRLIDLVESPDLRRKLGENGKARAVEVFDWEKIYRQYQALYEHLGDLRAVMPEIWERQQPNRRPSRLEPYDVFACYPTKHLSGTTKVAAQRTVGDWESTRSAGLFSAFTNNLESAKQAGDILNALSDGPKSLDDLGRAVGRTAPALRVAVAQLLKADILRVVDGG